MPEMLAPLSEHDCRLGDFAEIVEVETSQANYPLCAEIASGVVVYDAERVNRLSVGSADHLSLQAEVSRALLQGPGIVVFRSAITPSVLDAASKRFYSIIEEERNVGRSAGDHFAKPGANDRIWNALEKLAVADPKLFVDYYQCPSVAFASQAWLGPGYQMTSQVNVVNPGGEAQQPHRDYHLGFMSNEQASRFPAHVHRLSPLLTLQGAIAHIDMPVETGPTLYLPHSQKYEAGYLAWRQPEFIDYFNANHVQLPLSKGDAVFFNPALFHAAGTNRTVDVRRMANLLQVSSAMGRAMERIDRTRIVLAVYPHLLNLEDKDARDRALACAAEGYAFPADLDRDQPVGGLSPSTQADTVQTAIAEQWSSADLDVALRASPGQSK